MFQLRLVQCEVGGGSLEASRTFGFSPLFNLIVGDPGSGKTSLVNNLVDAFCGPSGATGGYARLQFTTPKQQTLELKADWTQSAVQLIHVEDQSVLFSGDSWSGLLDFLERHTGLSGLAATVFLSAEDIGWSLPASVAALVAPASGVDSEPRKQLEEQRRDLLEKQQMVQSYQHQMLELKEQHEHQIQRFRAVPDGFLQLLTTLVNARAEVARLQAEETAHDEQVRKSRADLEAARAELESRYSSLGELDAEHLELLKRYHEIEADLRTRRAALEALQGRHAEVRERLAACQVEVARLPPDFEARLARLLEREPVELVEAGPQAAYQEVMDALAACRFDGAAADFPSRLAELATTRRGWQQAQAELAAVQVRLHSIGFEGVRHQGAVQWPEDFPDQLGKLRSDQVSQQARLAELEQDAAHWREVSTESEVQHQALQQYEGLQEELDDFPERLQRLLEGRQSASTAVSALEDKKHRMGEIETVLAAEYDYLEPFGEDYPAQLEQLCRQMVQLGVQRKVFEASRADVERLQLSRQELVDRMDREYGDIRHLPADFPKKLREYDKLIRLQNSLEARRTSLRQQLDVKRAQLDSELSEFHELPAETLDQLAERGHRDTVLLQLLMHIDTEILERRRTEAAMANLEASMRWLPSLPDGLPVLQHVTGEYDKLLGTLDQQLSEAAPDNALTAEQREALLKFYGRQQEQARLRGEVETARTTVSKLQGELEKESLPLSDADVDAWLTQQEVAVALSAEGGRRTGLLSWFGSGSDEVKEQMANTERERARILGVWKLSSPDEVPALLVKNRTAKEKLAAAKTRLEELEAVLARLEREELPPDLKARSVSTAADVPRVLAEQRQADAWEQRHEVLQGQRAALVEAMEKIQGEVGALQSLPDDVNLTEAYERQRRMQDERIRLQARLELLRAPEALETSRQDLLKFVAQGLLEIPDDMTTDEGIRRLLRYQELNKEIADLQASIDQSAPGSKVGKLHEQLAQQRSQLENELGSAVTADQVQTTQRYQEYQAVGKELEELDNKLASMGDETQESLDQHAAELQEGMQRLHVTGEEAVGAALKNYTTWRALKAEYDGLKDAVDMALDRQLSHLSELESAVGRWGENLTDAEPLLARWREARAAQAKVHAVDYRLRGLPPAATLEAERDQIRQALGSRCRDLGVPATAETDLELLARWSGYVAWRQERVELEQELDRITGRDDSGMSRLEGLSHRAEQLEAALGLEPGDDLVAARLDFSTAQALRGKAEKLSVEFSLVADLEERQVEELADLGLPSIAESPGLSLQRYREYGSALQALRQVEQEVEGLVHGRDGGLAIPELEKTSAELKPLLHGREAETPETEAALLQARDADMARCVDMEMVCATQTADVQGRQALEAATRQVGDLAGRLGEWGRGDPQEILSEYSQYSEARAEAYRLRDALTRLPALQDVQDKLTAVDRELATLEASPEMEEAAHALNEFFEHCQARASDIVTRVSAGRSKLEFDGDEVRVVSNDGAETEHAPRPGDLWWKLAVCLELGTSHPWPVVLDEPFAGLSTGDKMELSELLMEISTERQVIVLTQERGLAVDITSDLNLMSSAAR